MGLTRAFTLIVVTAFCASNVLGAPLESVPATPPPANVTVEFEIPDQDSVLSIQVPADDIERGPEALHCNLEACEKVKVSKFAYLDPGFICTLIFDDYQSFTDVWSGWVIDPAAKLLSISCRIDDTGIMG
ncbi:hypothetical protein B0A52_08039 [Exophiala mesophila]|uniref:Uncharacterized protein n=1 Tax=Exophiala mesophila TaxID=212818 RepID=A0A438MZ11_EXOME|nr:hypothetical protein B0A52_08039 [Exophiala mesophila]